MCVDVCRCVLMCVNVWACGRVGGAPVCVCDCACAVCAAAPPPPHPPAMSVKEWRSISSSLSLRVPLAACGGGGERKGEKRREGRRRGFVWGGVGVCGGVWGGNDSGSMVYNG